jgi:hypothetical protein
MRKMWEWLKGPGVAMAKNALASLSSLFAKWIEPNILPAISALGEFTLRILSWVRDDFLPKLTDALVQGGGALAGWIVDAIPKLRARLQEFVGKIGTFIEETLPVIVDKAKKLGDAFVDWVGPAIRQLPTELMKLAVTIVKVLVEKVIPAIVKVAPKILWALISWTAELGVDLIVGVTKAFAELVKSLPGLALSLVKGFLNIGVALSNALSGAVIAGLNKIIDGLNSLLEFEIGLPFGKKFTIDAPDIPHIPALGEGGVIKRPTLALVGEAGPEAVVPLPRVGKLLPELGGASASSSVVYEINVQTGIGDPATIGKAIVESLQAYQRRTGNIAIKVA